MKKLLICGVAAAAMLFASCATSAPADTTEEAKAPAGVTTEETATEETEAPAEETTEEAEAPVEETTEETTEEAEAPVEETTEETTEEAEVPAEETVTEETEAPAEETTEEAEAPVVENKVLSGNWVATEVLMGEDTVIGAEATLNIEGPVYAIAGNAGVNNYFGNVAITDGNFNVDTEGMKDVAATLMIGPEEDQAFEDAYMAAFTNSDKIALEGDTLVISSEHSKIVYTKASGDETVTPDLAGSWETSEVVINNTTITGATATLDIVPMYKLAGNAGVNNYFGKIAVKGSSFGLDKDSFGFTKMLGPDEAQNFEDVYMTVFLNSNAIAVEGDSLVVSGENGKIVYNKAE